MHKTCEALEQNLSFAGFMRFLLPFLFSTTASAHILVGSLASSIQSKSVAIFLIEPVTPNQDPVFLRVGYELADNWYIKEIKYNKVIVCKEDKCESYRPGDEGMSYVQAIEDMTKNPGFSINEDNSVITVKKELKDQIVSKELAKVIMQAASKLVYSPPPEEALMGIELLEIDKGSIYEAFGLQDGDIITKLDDVSVTNIVETVKQLKGLQNVDSFKFTIIRDHVEKTITVNIKE